MRAHVIRLTTACFLALAALVHVLQPEFNAITTGLSRHETGPYGYVMSLGFVVFAAALLTAGLELRRRGRLGSVLLFGAAAGGLIVAAVPSPPPPVSNIRFLVHQSAGLLMLIGAIGGASAGSGAFQPDPAARFPGMFAVWCARVAAVIGALFVLSIGVDATGRGSIVGLMQRATFVALCGWLLALSSAKGRP